MLNMHNYIFILCMNSAFIQNITVFFDISIFPYLFPNADISNLDLWHHKEHSIVQIIFSDFDVTIMTIVYLCIFLKWVYTRGFKIDSRKQHFFATRKKIACAKFGWNWLSGSGEDFSILSIYFRHFVIISPWIREGLFIWTKLNHLYPRMPCAKFGWNLPSGSGKDDF